MGGRQRGAFARPGAVPETEGEPDVDDGEHAEPQHQTSGVPLDDSLIDGQSDEDGHDRLATLMARPEEHAERDGATLAADCAPQHFPSPELRLLHASLRIRLRSAREPHDNLGKANHL